MVWWKPARIYLFSILENIIVKKFISRTLIFIFVTLVILELLCRLFIDPVYFYKLDTYNEKSTGLGISFNRYSNMLSHGVTKHVDYLFIGSSRVPATINPKIFKEKDTNKTVLLQVVDTQLRELHTKL